MHYVVTALLILGAQLSLTAFVPAPAGKAWLLWPFAEDSKPWLGGIGGLPRQRGSVVTPVLAGSAGLGFLAAALGLLGIGVPANWWPLLVIVAAMDSLTLHALYFGRWSPLPIVLDVMFLWGVLVQHWSVAGLRGFWGH